jgi:two-component system, LytTR family, sensor histidine kinase AlgZ
MLIQPLVENAVYHGIEPRPEGGTILIKAQLKDKQIYLQVCNPLSTSAKESNGNRIAQQNIRARLATLYGKRAAMDVQEDRRHVLRQSQLALLEPFR